MEPKGVVAASEPRWISVDKRYPKEGTYVLVFTSDGEFFVDFYDGLWFGNYGVTHWMPLPAPPKEVP